MRRTKIVCTIGPASESVPVLKEMLAAGMNVARLNFSHGSHEEHLLRLRNIRQASRETGLPIAILLDTKGPEIRIGELDAPLQLEAGQDFCLTTVPDVRENKIYVNYPGLPGDVKPGDRILIDDGLIGLVVKEVTATEIHCLVENGGELSGRKGVNVPGVSVNLPSVTEKDLEDILFGIEQGVDFIAASFVRTAADVLEIRKVLEEHDSPVQIIAKIETQAAVDNIAEILEVSDGIMVARGDLGVEIPAEEVPLVQKQIIAQCNLLGKPVITATQMLDSMIRNPTPTRAEVTDVANAIFEGTDAVMLSGETAVGRYPTRAVQVMDRIARRVEEVMDYAAILREKAGEGRTAIDQAVSLAACQVSLDLQVGVMICSTFSGATARFLSQKRPKAVIFATSPNEHVVRQLALAWGVYAVHMERPPEVEALVQQSIEQAKERGLVSAGDIVTAITGLAGGTAGSTNMLRVLKVD